MWIFVIAIFFGLCFASLLYLFNKKQHYSKSLTTLLFILRCTATSLLVILFFNPFFKIKKKTIEPATIIIAQDNSTSLILSKDSTFYKNEYPNTLDSLTNKLKKSHIVDKYLFGNKVREFDSIDYQDYYTDFHNLLTTLKKDYYKKNGGIIFPNPNAPTSIYEDLEFVEDILPQLAKDREVTILDFGCGKSYLTFAMYYYLKVLKDNGIICNRNTLLGDTVSNPTGVRLGTAYMTSKGWNKKKFYKLGQKIGKILD